MGSFELEKISAAIHTKEGEITPAKFQIKFSPLGSIDDTFASFIANHENVSISNTSNNIKEYCRVVKEEIAQQGKFTIPFLGFLTMQNGKIAFVQTDELDMGAAALPLPDIDANLKMKANKKLDFSYPSAQKAYKRKKLSIGKFVIPAIVVLMLGVGCFVASENTFQIIRKKRKLLLKMPVCHYQKTVYKQLMYLQLLIVWRLHHQ